MTVIARLLRSDRDEIQIKVKNKSSVHQKRKWSRMKMSRRLIVIGLHSHRFICQKNMFRKNFVKISTCFRRTIGKWLMYNTDIPSKICHEMCLAPDKSLNFALSTDITRIIQWTRRLVCHLSNKTNYYLSHLIFLLLQRSPIVTRSSLGGYLVGYKSTHTWVYNRIKNYLMTTSFRFLPFITSI